MNPKKSKYFFLLIILVLIIPIILYVYIFSIHLSSDHQRWAEFGSYIGGIYTAILTALVLAVLVRQTNIQEGMNKHEFDQAHIIRAEKDLEYYIDQLDKELNIEISEDATLASTISDEYSHISDEILMDDEQRKSLSSLHFLYPKVLNIWTAIYPILIGLNKVKELPYELSFNSSIVKLQSILSVGVCIGLDNLYFCYSKDAMKGNYFFRGKETKKVKTLF